MGFFRVIFFIVFVYILVKFISILYRLFLKSSSSGNNPKTNNNKQREGEINIKNFNQKKEHPTDKLGGEYVDFEEVKDN